MQYAWHDILCCKCGKTFKLRLADPEIIKRHKFYCQSCGSIAVDILITKEKNPAST
jgi:DNA-directed RNA polymerase subunit RPC12/RpoP